MPKKIARIDGQPRIRYPNARAEWAGCPMTCPDRCPYEECTMPPEVAASLEPPHWHGWVYDKNGNVVRDSLIRKWAKNYKEAHKWEQ